MGKFEKVRKSSPKKILDKSRVFQKEIEVSVVVLSD